MSLPSTGLKGSYFKLLKVFCSLSQKYFQLTALHFPSVTMLSQMIVPSLKAPVFIYAGGILLSELTVGPVACCLKPEWDNSLGHLISLLFFCKTSSLEMGTFVF